MAKRAEQNRLSSDKGVTTLEHRTLIDDSLLPSADELEKLNSISKSILPWIMERTEKEQDARIDFNRERMNLAKNEQKQRFRYDMTALMFAFVIVLIFIGAAIYLIANEKYVSGSIFGGAVVVLLVKYFISSSKQKQQ